MLAPDYIPPAFGLPLALGLWALVAWPHLRSKLMSDKHRDPEYLTNSRIVRAQVRRSWRLGIEVHCWRCGRHIEPGMPFDVGHLTLDGGHGRDNLAPECRPCNRGHGGRIGAALTNARRAHHPRPAPAPATADRARLAPW